MFRLGCLPTLFFTAAHGFLIRSQFISVISNHAAGGTSNFVSLYA